MIKVIVFDLDGTLIDSVKLTAESIILSAKKASGKNTVLEDILKHFGPPENVLFERLVGKEKSLECLELYLEHFEKNLNKIFVFPHVFESLEKLKPNFKLVLATARGKLSLNLILDKFPLASLFDLILNGNDLTRYKPETETLEKIAKFFNVKNTEILMVGDMPNSDAKMAKRFGCESITVAIDGYDQQKEINKVADEKVVRSFEELYKYLTTYLSS